MLRSLTILFLLAPTARTFSVPPVSLLKRSSVSSLFLTGKGFGSKDEAPPKEYPALSQEEVEQWMGHIPVYAVTDEKGNGQAIEVGSNKRTAFYFFLSPIMAEAFRKQIQPSITTQVQQP